MKTNPIHTMFERSLPLSFRELKKYVLGRSRSRKHKIERRMEGNAFSAEAAEGFSLHPEALAMVPALSKQIRMKSGLSSSRWLRFSLFTAIPAVILLAVLSSRTAPRNENRPVSAVETILENNFVCNQMMVIENSARQESSFFIPVLPHTDSTGQIQVSHSNENLTYFRIPSRNCQSALADFSARKCRQGVLLNSYGLYPLAYFYDMKVVDYERLYNPQRIVRGYLSGIEARYENRTDTMTGKWVELNLVQTTRYMNFLSDAMGTFSAGKYNEAITMFNLLAFQNPGDVNAQFYGGMCYYYTGRYEEAISLLGQAEKNRVTVFDQESKWFTALSLQKLGRMDEYRKLMEEISESDGFYSERAKSNLLSSR